LQRKDEAEVTEGDFFVRMKRKAAIHYKLTD